MQKNLEILNTDNYLLILSFIVLFLFIGFIVLLINNIKINNKYKNFIKKLGNSNTIEEDLKKFMCEVEKVEEQNFEIINSYKTLSNNMSNCIQKIGIVRYSAFKDTGSDLSFAVALLDEHNNGVVFNGIYSREMSNIYAKPVNNGNSKYTLSEEEIQAVNKAMNSDNIYKIKIN